MIALALRGRCTLNVASACSSLCGASTSTMSESSTKEEVDAYGHPRIPHRGYYERGRCDLRRRWVEKFASSSLTQLGQWWKDEGTEDSRSCLKLKGNIENPIGLAKIPTGVAGPLLMEGQHVSGYMLLPFATTEGALVASTTRGAAALNRSGGVHVVASEQRQLRCPVFVTRSAMEALQLFQWLESNLHLLQKQVSYRFSFSTFSLLRTTSSKLGLERGCIWYNGEMKRYIDLCKLTKKYISR